jgi:hypothetical protein
VAFDVNFDSKLARLDPGRSINRGQDNGLRGGKLITSVLGFPSPLYLWVYNDAMQPVNFPSNSYNQIGASGECPHCSVNSLFDPMASHVAGTRVVSAAQCVTCKNFVLVIGYRGGGNSPSSAVTVYPLGKPDDTVASEVQQAAKDVAEDFAEALRCHWIKSYRASVVTCRRAIQSSAIAFQANGGRLIDQIDDLFKSGKITEALKDFAHEVRLTGNDGAHPDRDGLTEVKERDSADIIEFTREYLHHVYVMPAKLKARKTPASTATPPIVP